MRQLSLIFACVLVACVDRAEVGAFGPDAGSKDDGGAAGDAGGANDDAGQPLALDVQPATTPIAAGGMTTCAIDEGGGVQCWGDNAHGDLGSGSFDPTMSAVPLRASGLVSGVRAVSGGPFGMCALLDSGGARCWGRSLFGEIAGTGGVEGVNMPSPHDKTGLSNDVAEISFGFDFLCALTRAGRAKCWGMGGAGQLGNGTTADAFAARDVAMNDDRYVHVSASMGGLFACAVVTTGDVACWGKNDERQLGVGDTDDRRTPTRVIGLGARAVGIGAGRAHACAILEDGGVACWGSDRDGQLGRGQSGAPSAPVRVAGVTAVKQLAVGAAHACALLGTGAVSCWGSNDGGAIADPSQGRTLPPTEVAPAAFGAAAVAAGNLHTCVATADRRVRCIGSNLRGQTGKGDFTL